ncbi:DUF7281 domain-containing protein [Paralysiella testudinis]|uniref:DUF7281 domain-containing protein n=1 Tax=Paralysiella testudinis TaxID=2809020 RepID=A0A892ZHD1_9NEIS|nr:hypothetical protein [Paralysiella testudinis]QRQ81237.1 hypothetical protein JQU52_10985 [Paralysiella testudinis]
MNKNTLMQIQKALRERPTHVKANKIWQQLHHEENIGTPGSGGLILSESDLSHLETIYARHSKQSAEHRLPKHSDRMDTAAVYRNEKYSARNVFADMLVFAAPHATLPLKQGHVPGGIKGLVPTVMLPELAIADIHKLIVVENGNMLTRWHDWHLLLPENWQDALLLYRGHGQNSKQVRQLINLLPENSKLAIYPDFDPAGLGIAADFAQLRHFSVAIPQNWPQLRRNHPDNQEAQFIRQTQSTIDAALTKKLQPFPPLTLMLAHLKQQHLALMQENCLRLGGLQMVEIK